MNPIKGVAYQRQAAGWGEAQNLSSGGGGGDRVNQGGICAPWHAWSGADRCLEWAGGVGDEAQDLNAGKRASARPGGEAEGSLVIRGAK